MNHQWPPEVTRAMHELADAAPVAPSLTSVLEHRPTTTSSGPIATALNPNRMSVQYTEEDPTMIDLEAPSQTDEARKGPKRVLVACLVAAAAVVAIAIVAIREDDPVSPADQPSPTVTVPPRALFGARAPDEQFVPGTYFVDEVGGSPTPRILVTLGEGWSMVFDGWKIGNEGAGAMSFSRPDRVWSDACHMSDGFHPGPVTALDGLVAALSEQGGWTNVTAPSDITINGYAGKTFQRTAPAEFTDCTTTTTGAEARLRSWENGNPIGGSSLYEPSEVETLLVVDVNGTIILINTRLTPNDQEATAAAELAAVLDSIRIAPA